MKIVLIGFMGSGKSTLAAELSTRLRLRQYEMDSLICERAGYESASEFFRIAGESEFRRAESDLCRILGAVKEGIISTGGGAAIDSLNAAELRKNQGRFVYLYAPFDVIAERLSGFKNRPLFSDLQAARSLYDSREKIYRSLADLIVDSSTRTPEEIAVEIEHWAKLPV